VTGPLEKRLREALGEGALAAGLPAAAEPLERSDAAALLAGAPRPLRAGLARALAAQPALGRFLSHRPLLLQRIAAAGRGTLAARARELERWEPGELDDVEGVLDALRLLRREETCLAACLHFAGAAPFEEVSTFLSELAETIARRALDLARHATASALPFAVIGMGKIAGREFTYHSDLDLLFLYEGGPEAVAGASRVGQRLISALTTMTGAGVAYPVDTRLRPSGRQGMLVTSLAAFEHYQCEQAQTWEHVALLRARPIAGSCEAAAHTLARIHARVCAAHAAPWPALCEMRGRVEAERARAEGDALAFKTGAGGLMDVDFLAGGGVLERAPRRLPALPSVPSLLRAALPGARADALLSDYAFLRRVEAAARWYAGRAVEAVAPGALPAVAELCEPGLSAAALRAQLLAAFARVRGAWERVTRAGSIEAL
jgi:glutamate-ammonia-ligase adenylyltransferase